jgi:cell division initiation protein
MFDPALSSKEDRADKEEQERHHGRSTGGAASPRDNTMNVSPLDLRQQRFRTVLRGFDKVEVASFLAAVADDYEQALRETDRLRQDLGRMEAVLSEHREHEKNLKATLMTAQRLADDIRTHAEQEAKRIIQEAEGRSDLLLDKTQARLEDIQREIDGLKLKRKDVETTIEASIQTLRNTLEFVRDQEAHEREDRVLLHRPRTGNQPAADQPSAADSRPSAVVSQ